MIFVDESMEYFRYFCYLTAAANVKQMPISNETAKQKD